MLLTEYLAREGMTYAEFGRRIGTPHARTVERYAKGMAIPNRKLMAKIVEVTSCEVQPNDFYLSAPASKGEALTCSALPAQMIPAPSG